MAHLQREDFIWAIRQRHEQMAAEANESFSERKQSKRAYGAQQDYQTKILASLVPDEIIHNRNDYTHKSYNVCLLFGDVSGFTELCEKYNEIGKGGPSRLTRVLNGYIGAMVQEVMSFGGDVLKFSGDAFLAMWKCKTSSIMRDYVHEALDCALVIQKNYGRYETDVGVYLRVKLAISAGPALFSLIGDEVSSHYVVIGQPVLDVKEAEHKSKAGEIIVAPSAWYHVNFMDYIAEELDAQYYKVLGVGPNWRHGNKDRYLKNVAVKLDDEYYDISDSGESEEREAEEALRNTEEFAVRPAFNLAFAIKDELRKFIIKPVLTGIDCNEPIEFLTEMRQVVIVFINIVAPTTYKSGLSAILTTIDLSYKIICKNATKYQGCVNKVSLFDKDIMFVLIFGLRGFKHDLECQQALKCSAKCYEAIVKLRYVTSVSVSCTTGKTYCGVVGHTLRREYTVISLTVNKAARLMVNYPDKVTCDRQTFQHSKMEAKHFILQEYKPLKGISNPGPVYEFRQVQTAQSHVSTTLLSPYPLLGRDEEIIMYQKLVNYFLDTCRKKKAGRANYKDRDTKKIKMLIIEGHARQGKTRLLEECVFMTKKNVPVNRILLHTKDETQPYRAMKFILSPPLGIDVDTGKADRMKILKDRLWQMQKPELLCILNDIFNVDFPVTSLYGTMDDGEREIARTKVLRFLFVTCFVTPWVIAIDNADYMDDYTWRILPLLLETDNVFVLMTIQQNWILNDLAQVAIKSSLVKVLILNQIGELFHAALSCQILNIYAIPADLENLIQFHSNGNPGWIESFLIMLIQAEKLIIQKMNLKNINKQGLVTPPLYMMHRLSKEKTIQWKHIMEEKSLDAPKLYVEDPWHIYIDSCRDPHLNTDVREAIHKSMLNDTMMRVGLLAETFNLSDVDSELSKDVMILKTFDSLTYHEQLLLKCSSVLGDTFPRKMLVYLLTSDSARTTADAVKKLFEKGVLCCAKGDFSEGGNYVLIRSKIVDPSKDNVIRCDCKGLDIDETCEDFPKYASCGFLRFRSSNFRETTYTLLTDSQKKEFHTKAAKYILKETRKCTACGNGYFINRDQVRLEEPIHKISKFKRVKKLIQLDSLEFQELFTMDSTPSISSFPTSKNTISHSSSMYAQRYSTMTNRSSENEDLLINLGLTKEETSSHNISMGLIGPHTIFNLKKSWSLTKTFSSLNFSGCDCHLILNSMHGQLKTHYKGSEQWIPMLDSIIDYANICISNKNPTAAMNAIKEALLFIETSSEKLVIPAWQIPLLSAKCYTLYGIVLMELEQKDEAFRKFMLAMNNYGYPFPTKKIAFYGKLWKKKLYQRLGLYLMPDIFVQKSISSYTADVIDSIAECLSWICRIFMSEDKWKQAELAGVWSLTRSLQAQTNLKSICDAFSNMILVAHRQKNKFLQMVLEVHALRYCHKKKCRYIEPRELKSVIRMYSTILEVRLANSELDRALHIGYVALKMSVSTSYITMTTQLLPLLVDILLAKLYLLEVITLLHELHFYADTTEDNTGRTWYYTLCLYFHLETGYTFTLFQNCELYWHGEGIEMSNIRNYGAKNNFISAMWVWHLRNEQWEAASVLRKEIDRMCEQEPKPTMMCGLMLMRLVEGHLLLLVHKINRRNIYELQKLKQRVNTLLKYFGKVTEIILILRPRYFHNRAYHAAISDNPNRVAKFLKKAEKAAISCDVPIETKYLAHSEKVFKQELPAAQLDLWQLHCDTDHIWDYHDIDMNDLKLCFFSLPLPFFET